MTLDDDIEAMGPPPERPLARRNIDVVREGRAALRDRVPNRELSVEEFAAWRRALAVAREDERSMQEWKLRGFVSGDPGDRPRVDDDAYESGGEWACEHGYSGRHFLPGADSPCRLLVPNIEDWFLTDRPVVVRESKPDPYPYHAARPGDEAELDSLDALMSESPARVRDGGGTMGLEDAYHVARARMSVPLYDGDLSMKGGPHAQDDP
jgi:hypothetical protein